MGLDSTSDAVGAGQKTTCCDDACGKVTFKAGKGTDDSGSTTYYCGENKVPVARQKDAPSGSDSVGSGQKSKCCAAAGKKPKSPASGTMYCGDGMSPKSALADTVCAGDDCVEATDAGTYCEKTKVNNTTATTDASTTGASMIIMSGALLLSFQ